MEWGNGGMGELPIADCRLRELGAKSVELGVQLPSAECRIRTSPEFWGLSSEWCGGARCHMPDAIWS